MTNDQFIALDSALLRRAEEILNQRKGAYATNSDRLANFKEGAARSGITPLQVCHLYLQKGLSVVDKIAQGNLPPGETIEERICDAINYLRLFYACYKEANSGEDVTMEYFTHAPDNHALHVAARKRWDAASCGQAYEKAATISSEHDEVAKALDRMPHRGYRVTD